MSIVVVLGLVGLSGCGIYARGGSSSDRSFSEPIDDLQIPDDTGTPKEKEVCDEVTPVTLFISPDDSNSMSSPVQVRSMVLAGWGKAGSVPVRPSGGTDLSGGLTAGYELAAKHASGTRINRIVLVSDGGANVGQTDEDIIGRYAGDQDEDGIYMVGVGVGDAGYNDLLMDRVTDLGRGASVFVPHADESKKMFADRFLETMSVAAREVQIRYDLPPGFEIVRFSAEEVSTDPEEIEPQHVSPNDSMVLHQELEACGEVDPKAEITVVVTYADPITFEAHEVSTTQSVASLLAADSPQLAKGAAVFAYAQAMRADKEGTTVAEALAAVTAALDANPSDADLIEIRGVLSAL